MSRSGLPPSPSLNLSHRASLARDQREASRVAAVGSPASRAALSLSPSPNGPSPSPSGPSLNITDIGYTNQRLNHRASLARDPREASRAAAVASRASLAAQSQSPSPSPNGPRLAGESPSHGVHLNGLSPSPNPNHRASLARDPRDPPREASRVAAVASPASRAAQSPSLSPNGQLLSGEHGVRLSMMDGVSLSGPNPNPNHRASLARDQREASRVAAVANLASLAAQSPSPSPNGPRLSGEHGVHRNGLSPNPNPNHRASLANPGGSRCPRRSI